MNEAASRAPALEKGLDILELLAEQRGGLSQKDVAARLGRSASEIFRILGALERRRYISRDPATGQYSLTRRLYELAHIHPPTRRLIDAALPKMEVLASEADCSCHLVVRDRDFACVIAHAQPEGILMGWNVRVGAVFPIEMKYASARVLAAFAGSAPNQRGITHPDGETHIMDWDDPALDVLRSVQLRGYDEAPSTIAPGVTDVSFPVLNHLNLAIAALTVPCVEGLISAEKRKDVVIPCARRAAAEISAAVGGR